MSEAKKKGATAKPEPVTLYDINVCGPDALDLAAHPTDATLRQWWDRAKVYTQAMVSLNRVTMLCYIPDEHKFYLASVPEVADDGR